MGDTREGLRQPVERFDIVHPGGFRKLHLTSNPGPGSDDTDTADAHWSRPPSPASRGSMADVSPPEPSSPSRTKSPFPSRSPTATCCSRDRSHSAFADHAAKPKMLGASIHAPSPHPTGQIPHKDQCAWPSQMAGTSGYTRRSKFEVQISRSKRVIDNTLRSCGHPQRKTEARIAVKALNRMNELGRPMSVRVA